MSKLSSLLLGSCSLIFLTVKLHALGADDATRPSPPSAEARVRVRERVLEYDPSKGRGGVMAGKDDVLLPSLLGLAIGSAAGEAERLQLGTKSGVAIEGFSTREAEALRKVAMRAIGKPVSLRSLESLSAEFDRELRSQGRMFMRISFPPQEITAGVVAIRICPARADQVMMVGKVAFGTEFVKRGFRTRSGDLVSGEVVLDDLDWLNENPLRRATIGYGDGSSDDLIDLTLRMKAEKPWRAYAGFDNQLSEDLGDERFFLGFQQGNVFGLDHRFTGQYTSALDFSRLQGGSVAYEIPLPTRHLLEFAGGYTESQSPVAGPLDQSGRFGRGSVMYRVPLPRYHMIGHEWRIGAEFRNSDYEFASGSEATVKSFQIETGWKGKRADRWGLTRLDLALGYSPGAGILGSEDEDYIRLGASGAEFLIGRIELERTVLCGKAGTLLARVNGQLADGRLLSSDQFYSGGVSRVRGFDETVGYASDGIFGSLEMQSETWKSKVAGDFSAVGFVDGAVLKRDYPTDPGELLSVGAGLRWSWDNHYSARVDYGIPLVSPEDEDDGGMFHFGLTTIW